MSDTNYSDWKPGDWLIWDIDDDKATPVQITRIDEYGRVYWLEDGQEVLTRATNMARIKHEQEKSA